VPVVFVLVERIRGRLRGRPAVSAVPSHAPAPEARADHAARTFTTPGS
jgi:hypothetical protein